MVYYAIESKVIRRLKFYIIRNWLSLFMAKLVIHSLF